MQTAVSHSSTEAQLISLDAGLRLAGDPALNLWDTVIDLLGPQAARDPMRNTKPKKTKSLMADKRVTDSIDYVPPNTQPTSVFLRFRR